MKIDLSDVTFIIPLRIDCFERVENVAMITAYLSSCFVTNVFLLETGEKRAEFLKEFITEDTSTFFLEDFDEIFHRTRFLNLLTQKIVTPYVAVWDSDVLVHPMQLLVAVERLRNNTHDFVFPYDGRFLNTDITHRVNFLRNKNIQYLLDHADDMALLYPETACGGGFVARLADYTECGGENERFHGWGLEDGERVRRWQTLEKRITRVKGPLFHLHHPRGKNSMYFSDQQREDQRIEFRRITTMNKMELLEEITKWQQNRNSQ